MFDFSSIKHDLFSSKEYRALRIIIHNINKMDLRLTDYTVLTEVGSNNYVYAPIIAALSGADKVYAWTADTQHGLGNAIAAQCADIAYRLGVKNRIEFCINKRDMSHVECANIITNSGFVRPIESQFVKRINPDRCVVPLMYEAWELRDSDIDITACKKKKVRIAGTWESHPDLKVFQGTGQLAVKLALDAGFEVYRNKIAVWSDDEFGQVAKAAFENAGASNVALISDRNELLKRLPSLDFVYFCDYFGRIPLVSQNGILQPEDIKSLNPGLGVVHLFGELDANFCRSENIDFYPKKSGSAEQMTETLAYLGPDPVLSLTVAGLKVGQILLSGEINPLAQSII
ncbi:hypothetical protein MIB92_09055 [Aestuariirhabdus sp. Z084]|uniref:hypothetical protein n=1 Tax=Aestuariirhabdus haliotis TaxID=2918751 RepID=UPI0020C0E289|nr:hypothetical protein [Aestuariirhabdus haliotis]MCL6415799.1 hypothetical protein [Aestuariirhabdus haliotis]